MEGPVHRTDPLGPAQKLGVAVHASSARVREAFVAQALRWHPDRNSDPAAEDRFREVREAYRTLAGKMRNTAGLGLGSAGQPLTCRGCGAQERSLRAVAVTRLHSRVIISIPQTRYELSCHGCARQSLLAASLSSGLFGIWSLNGLPLVVATGWRNARAWRDAGRHLDLRLALQQQPAASADDPSSHLSVLGNLAVAGVPPLLIISALLYRFL